MHYQIEYYNKLWRDWLAFDQLFYKTEEDAQKAINYYIETRKPSNFQTKIIQTNILDEKPKKKPRKNLGAKVTTEKA
jgi:hypothetical protein